MYSSNLATTIILELFSAICGCVVSNEFVDDESLWEVEDEEWKKAEAEVGTAHDLCGCLCHCQR